MFPIKMPKSNFFKSIKEITIKKDGFLISFFGGYLFLELMDLHYTCVLCKRKTSIRKRFPIQKVLCPDCSKNYPIEKIREVEKILKPYSSPSGYCTPLEKWEGQEGNFWYIREYVD